MRRLNRIVSSVLLVTFIAAVADLPLALAQPAEGQYRVGGGDTIFMSAPQRPDLNRELTVDPEGNVELPLIGKISVNGLTATEIENKLLQALRQYYPSITRLQITVTEAVSQVIYVSGEVRAPGRYTFANTVTVWEAIREAGGPLGTAQLDNVRIIKDRSRGGTSVMVNVLAAIEGGTMENLPELEAGDTVIIPAEQDVYTGSYGVNVFGAVVRPGTYRLTAGQDLISAVLIAGGPIAFADLKKIKIIRPRADGSNETVEINMTAFLEHGDPAANPKLKPGDTVNVPQKGRLIQLATSDFPTLLGLITAFATTALLIVTINDRANNN